MTVRFTEDEPDQPVFYVEYTFISQRSHSYPSYTSYYTQTSEQSVGPFDSKGEAEQAMFSVLSSGTAKHVRIAEYESRKEYQRYQRERYKTMMEDMMVRMGLVKDPETGEWSLLKSPPPKKKKWRY
jgi:hypothetical protein